MYTLIADHDLLEEKLQLYTPIYEFKEYKREQSRCIEDLEERIQAKYINHTEFQRKIEEVQEQNTLDYLTRNEFHN